MWILVNYYLWSNGHTLVDETSPGQWEVAVDAGRPRQGDGLLQCILHLRHRAGKPDHRQSWGDRNSIGGLGRGDCAITFFPPATFRASQSQSEAALLTAPIPKGSAKRISHLGGRALGINPASKHPEQAWEFVRYLVSPDTFKTYNQYPAQKSLLSAMTFPENEQGYVQMLPLAQTFERYISSPIAVSSMTALINREFGAVVLGQRTSEEASQAVLAELQDLLARGKN